MGKVKVLIATIIIWGTIFSFALVLKVSITLALIVSIIPALMIYLIYGAELLNSNNFAIVVENLPIGIFRNNGKKVSGDDTLEHNVNVEKICSNKSDTTKASVNIAHETQVEPKELGVEVLSDALDAKEIVVEVSDSMLENKEIIDEEVNCEESVLANVVYWTPNGKTYHKTDKCRTLSRSKMICNGTIEDSGKSHYCDQCS